MGHRGDPRLDPEVHLMAGVQDKSLVALKGWPLGVDNITPEFALKAGSARLIVDCDLYPDTGKLRRRDGYTKSLTTTRSHSLYRAPDCPFMLYVDNGALKSVTGEMAPTTLKSGLNAGLPLTYTASDRMIYWSNSQLTGRVSYTGAVSTWGVESPSGVPALAAYASGGLDGGTYQVAITYLRAGEEGGSTLAALVDITDGKGIQLTYIPQPVDAAVDTVRIYRSKANGDVLFWAHDLPVGVTSYIIGRTDVTAPLGTQFMEPMPAGQCVAWFNGMSLVMVDRVLYWSHPLLPGLTTPFENYLRFHDRGTMLAPIGIGADAGLYVAAGHQTYYLSGASPKTWQRVVAYPHGAVAGTLRYVRGSSLPAFLKATAEEYPVWVATNGSFVVGMRGSIQPLTENRVALPEYERGAALYRENRGIKQLIATLNNAGTQASLKASDSAVATIYRNGVEIP
jgi:hypothetical protein